MRDVSQKSVKTSGLSILMHGIISLQTRRHMIALGGGGGERVIDGQQLLVMLR